VNNVVIDGEDSFSLFIVHHFFCERCIFSCMFCFLLIGCAGSVGISLAGRVMYIFRACTSFLWDWRAGIILFGHSGGVDGGTVHIFLLFWLYIGGYCTGETVRGLARFSFFLQFAVCFLGGCMSAVGICCVIFCDGSFVVFFAVFFLFFFEVLIVNNLLQVVSQESEPWRGPGASAGADATRA